MQLTPHLLCMLLLPTVLVALPVSFDSSHMCYVLHVVWLVIAGFYGFRQALNHTIYARLHISWLVLAVFHPRRRVLYPMLRPPLRVSWLVLARFYPSIRLSCYASTRFFPPFQASAVAIARVVWRICPSKTATCYAAQRFASTSKAHPPRRLPPPALYTRGAMPTSPSPRAPALAAASSSA